MDKPSILFFDIETTPHILAGFTIQGKQSISYKQILKYPEVLCISWAWNDGKVQHSVADLSKYDWYEKNGTGDFKIVKDFVEMANKATYVVAHNGKQFDIAFLRNRVVKYKLPDFSPLLIDDTYLSTKDIKFSTHKLDGMGEYLGHGNKAEHGDGYEWWIDIMRGDKNILKRMVHYCDVDVVRLRDIYKHVAPYINSQFNPTVFYERPDACPNPLCGQSSRPLIIRGYYNTRAGKFPKFQCPVCGKYARKGTNMLKKPGNYNR